MNVLKNNVHFTITKRGILPIFSIKRVNSLSLADETWIGIYTVKDCYPVQETFTRNYSVLLSTRFFDVQLGIKDPSVFTPPSTCQTAQMERMSEDCP